MYSVYSNRDLPEDVHMSHGGAASQMDAMVENVVKLRVDQLQGSPPAGKPVDDKDLSHRRQLTDRSELIYPPPPGEAMVREYKICIGLAPGVNTRPPSLMRPAVPAPAVDDSLIGAL